MSNEHLTRQIEILPIAVLDAPITVIGAGAIGSFVTLTLAKMGFTDITVWDDDRVDTVNMNCQFYRFEDIGKYKVDALKEIVGQFSKTVLKRCNMRFHVGMMPANGITIVTVDSMRARKDIWASHVSNTDCKLYIDARMSAEDSTVYAVTPEEKDFANLYSKTLYSDSEAMKERCTAKSTLYTVLSISGHIGAVVKAFVTDQVYAHTHIANYKAFDSVSFKGQLNLKGEENE